MAALRRSACNRCPGRPAVDTEALALHLGAQALSHSGWSCLPGAEENLQGGTWKVRAGGAFARQPQERSAAK